MGSQSSYCLRHRRSRAADPRDDGRLYTTCEAYEGGRVTGRGHLVEAGYIVQVPRHAGTWRRYLSSAGTYPGPRQGYMGKLGPPLGLGTEQPGKAHGPFPPALLLGPLPGPASALPRYHPYPMRSFTHPAHACIHPPSHPPNTIIHGPTHGTMMHPYP